MADNDPKHTSRYAQQYLEEKRINWWRTPAESPDLNPIENMWHELKEYIRREVKPKTKEELIDGIDAFGLLGIDVKSFPRLSNDKVQQLDLSCGVGSIPT